MDRITPIPGESGHEWFARQWLELPTDYQVVQEDVMLRLWRERCERREAAVRRLVERVLGHAVPIGLEELAWLALQDMGVRIERVVPPFNSGSQETVFAHRGSTCIDSEPINYLSP